MTNLTPSRVAEIRAVAVAVLDEYGTAATVEISPQETIALCDMASAAAQAQAETIEECATIIESWMKWEPKIIGVSVAAPGYAAINTTLIRIRNEIRSLSSSPPSSSRDEAWGLT